MIRARLSSLRGPKPTLCFLAVLLGLAAKLALTAGAQISDAGDDPHEYVSQILHPADEGIADYLRQTAYTRYTA
jgi:hypothetical protein